MVQSFGSKRQWFRADCLDTARLKGEYEELEKLATTSDLIKIEPRDFAQPAAPVGYLVRYYCKALTKNHSTGKISTVDPSETKKPHVLWIHLPAEFPIFGPELRMQTPVFHPNIVDPTASDENFKRFPPGHVCIAKWAPSRSLRDIVLEVGEMLQYKRHGYQKREGLVDDYLFPVPVCNEAFKWLKENISNVPIDHRNLATFADIKIDKTESDVDVEIEDDIKPHPTQHVQVTNGKRVCTVCNEYLPAKEDKCKCGSSTWYVPRKFCLNCGRPLRDESKFCLVCGKPTRR